MLSILNRNNKAIFNNIVKANICLHAHFIGLEKSVTEEQIREVAQEFGEVKNVRILRSKYDNNNLRPINAVVNFSDHNSAMAAMDELDQTYLLGRHVTVQPFVYTPPYQRKYNNNRNRN